MTIEECYTRMGANYEDVLRRLGKEERIKKFLGMLLNDQSYAQLKQAFAEGKGEEAFRAAHSLKGICMNLGLETLYTSTNALTEELRAGVITEASQALAMQVEQDHQLAVDCIKELLEA